MKKYFLVLILLISLGLSACGEEKPAIVTASVEDIYTAVAITMTSQYTPATPTDTALPTSTNTVELTPTGTPTIAATPQPVIAYSSTTSSSSSACDSSDFGGDVTIPDGTKLAPGQTFKKTWLLKNNGTCNWTKDYEIVFESGDDMDGVDTAIDVGVSSGSQVKVSVTLVAPTKEGTYTGYWKMMNSEGNTFGTSFYVQIVVSDDASTLTPIPTSTGFTNTPTSNSVSAIKTSTVEVVATNTSVPPTATTAPTNTSEPPATATPTETTVVVETETPST